MRNTNTKKREKEDYNKMSTYYVKNMWWRAKKRAEKSGIEFNILKEDIVIPNVCPVLNIPLFYTKTGGLPSNNSPSLDRIDNSKGYTKDNIIVVSRRANVLKNDATIEELEKIVNFYKQL